MIYTVTCNPSLDYIVSVEDYKSGATNRTKNEIINPGGKGINVSLVLKNLGIESVPLGFVAGFTGKEILSLLLEKGMKGDFLEVSTGLSRINIKLRDVSGGVVKEETEVNGKGPDISTEDIEKLLCQVSQLSGDDILVLSGSIPGTVSETFYQTVMERISDKKVKVVVDATRGLLRNTLSRKPFLVKPNIHELEELFGVSITSIEEVIKYAKRLQDEGAKNVLVSMAGDGAILLAEDGKVYHQKPPKGNVVNSVGAGDSMVAGFLYGYLKTNDYEMALRYGIATGSASAFQNGFATKEEVEYYYQELTR